MNINPTAFSLIVKFVMVFILSLIAFLVIAVNTWEWAFLVALVVTPLGYFVGDVYVLYKYSNYLTSAGEGVVAAMVAFIISLVTPLVVDVPSLLAFATFIAIGEFFYHRYILQYYERVEV